MLKALFIAALLAPQSAYAECETILATDSSKVSKAGDTMTGTLSMDGASAYITSGSSITGNHFGDGSGLTNIGTSALANSAVDTTKLATDAVTTAKIINGAVDTSKLAPDAVTTAKILDGTITGPDVASSTIPLNALNQSGCSTDDVIKWGGSFWVCGTAGTGDVTQAAGGTYGSGATNDFSASVMVGGGLLRQHVSSTTVGRISNVAGSFPSDDSKPQITEGYKVLVATITPLNANSNIIVRGIVNYAETANNCNAGALCIFKNADADALACFPVRTPGSPIYGSVEFYWKEAAASTTLRNYSLRIGCEVTASLGINIINTSSLYGATVLSALELFEVAGP